MPGRPTRNSSARRGGGDRTAFAALIGRHERTVWATAWRVVRDGHAADDATQEAFLVAFRRLRSVRDPARFAGWICRVARREATNIARRRAREPDARVVETADARAGPGLSAGSEALLAAVAALPDHERVVVVRHYIDGEAVSTIAAACGRPVGTVTKQLSRAIARLKTTLKGILP